MLVFACFTHPERICAVSVNEHVALDTESSLDAALLANSARAMSSCSGPCGGILGRVDVVVIHLPQRSGKEHTAREHAP